MIKKPSLIIGFLFGSIFLCGFSSWGANKNIDLADKNFKLPNYYYESDKPTSHYLSVDYNTSFIWNSRQGFDFHYIWQPGIVGVTLGYSMGQASWGDLEVVACNLCSYSDPTSSLSPDSEIRKLRDSSDHFRMKMYHLGLNFMSHLLRRETSIYWQMRGEILYGEVTEEQYGSSYVFRGASFGSYLTFPINQSQSLSFSAGYSQRLGLLETQGVLSRFERTLYVQFGQLQLGLSKRL